MADPWKSMKVAEFEHVVVSASVALLRVCGTAPRRHSRGAPRPVLLADDGEKISRFAALPSPVDERRVLRAAYSVDADLIAPGTVFSLQLASGGVLSLPAPSPGAARIMRGPDVTPPADVEDGAEQPPGGDERRSDPQFKLTMLSARVAEAEQARDGLKQAAPIDADGDAEAGDPNERVRQAKAEAQRATAALAELEIWRGELERRLTETTDQLSAAKATLAEDERVMGRLGEELADAEAKVDLLQAQVQRLDEPLAPDPDAADPLRAALDEIEALRGQISQAREAETEARIEAIRHAAEAEARELAERELAQAAFAGK